MAVRDRNLFAWQAYVITMSFVSVGLLLGMFFLWRGYSDLSTKFESTNADLTTARTTVQTSQGRVDRLLSMLGYGDYTDADLTEMANKFATDEELAQVEKDFAEQMKLFPPNQPISEKNLLKLPKFLTDTIRLRNEAIEKARADLNKAQQEMNAKIADAEKARDGAQAAQDAAEKDLANERQAFAQERARLNAEKEEALAKYAEYKKDFDVKLVNLQNENQRLTIVARDQTETISQQMEEINQFRNPDFAAPQGEIRKVYNGGEEVWINLGQDDGLRVGVPFSVIDESAINISEAEPKAKLVVTNIVSDHLSRANITSYDYRNPVVTGDKIYSPAWRPGRTVGFALVGNMDINGDLKDDIEQIKELIRISGAKIDEVMDPKGVRTGPEGNGTDPGMSANTEFLVLGTDLTVAPNSASPGQLAEQQARAETYKQFISEARRKGIIEINLDKLMGYLKTDNSDRTVPLGDRIRGEDFDIRPSNRRPSSMGPVSPLFQKRSPK